MSKVLTDITRLIYIIYTLSKLVMADMQTLEKALEKRRGLAAADIQVIKDTISALNSGRSARAIFGDNPLPPGLPKFHCGCCYCSSSSVSSSAFLIFYSSCFLLLFFLMQTPNNQHLCHSTCFRTSRAFTSSTWPTQTCSRIPACCKHCVPK